MTRPSNGIWNAAQTPLSDSTKRFIAPISAVPVELKSPASQAGRGKIASKYAAYQTKSV
jgi:hypothetical protein